jgi:hypothetical protein
LVRRFANNSCPSGSITMNLARRSLAYCCLGSLLFAIVGSGCNQTAPTAGPARFSPEESFDLILATIRRGLETGAGVVASGGSVPHQDGGFTAISINNKISHEYFPGTRDGETPRATITVSSASRVSIQRAPAGADRNERPSRDSNSGMTDLDVDISDPGSMALSSGSGSRRLVPGAVSEVSEPRHNSEIRTYELVHRNGRWELVTEIDRETDLAVAEAFDYALSTQL